MAKIAAFVYGLLAYLLFFVTFLYAVGFVGNYVVPKSIDSGGGEFSIASLVVDALASSVPLPRMFQSRVGTLRP